MSAQPTLTDEQRRAHFSELGTRGAESRRATKAAVQLVVETTRAAQGLPPTVTDVEVLEHVAVLVAEGDVQPAGD